MEYEPIHKSNGYPQSDIRAEIAAFQRYPTLSNNLPQKPDLKNSKKRIINLPVLGSHSQIFAKVFK